MRLVIPGRPQSWERTQGSGRRRFKAPKTEAAQNAIKAEALRAGVRPMEGPLAVWLVFVFARPKRKPAVIPPSYWADGVRISRPVDSDVDNLSKLVLDALNGIAYADDRQVVELTASKCWAAVGEEPCTIVEMGFARWIPR